MKILMVTGPDITLREPFSSGIEAFVVSLANQLVQDGHEVDVIARDSEPDVAFSVIDLGQGIFGRLSERRQLRHFAKLDFDSYDVIHYNLFIPELYEIAATIDKPSFLTLHSPADQPRGATYRRLAARSNMKFIAVSSRIKQQWDAALHRDLPLIHNGIDLEQWRVKDSAGGAYLLWSGRINAKKNAAAAIALARHLHMPLKITGRIADQTYFDRKVRPHLNDQIQYLGHTTQDELLAIARGASAFVATATWQEPFGLNTLEMLASGLPVVGFESAIPPDLRYPGVSIAVPSHNWRDLIAPLSSVATTSPQQCRSFARTMNVEQMADEYAAFYETVVAQNIATAPLLTTDVLQYGASAEVS